jgi:hypothetical protein
MLIQKELGICLIKLLLLAFSTAKIFIASYVIEGKRPENKLLEIFSTLRGR